MAINLRSTSTLAYGARINSTVTAPAGAQTGDVIVVSLLVGDGSNVPATAPAGWTLAASCSYSAPDPWTVNQYVYVKPYDGATSWTFTHASANGAQAFAECWQGVDTTNPLDVPATKASTGANTGATSATAPSLTTVTDGCQLVVARGSWDGNAITPPSGWTERSDTPVLWVGDKTQATAGATGSVVVPGGSTSAQRWGIIMLALRPSGAAAAPNHGAATGSLTFSGSANGHATAMIPNVGYATGSLVFSGSATGHSDAVAGHHGSTSGTVDWAGHANGSIKPSGRASAALSWSSSAIGRAPVVGASEGHSAGSLLWTGSAHGSTARFGSTHGSFTWAGAATGHAPGIDEAHGLAAGSIHWDGTAHGSATHKGSANSALSWTGTAAGTTQHRGTASGSLTWSGYAHGLMGALEAGTPIPSPVLTLIHPRSALSLKEVNAALSVTHPRSDLEVNA